MRKEVNDHIRLKGTLLAVVLVFTLAMFPAPVSAQTYGPREDYLHVINYVDPDTEFAAMEAGSIDITDARATTRSA